MLKGTLLLAVACVLLAAGSACGGGDDADADAPPLEGTLWTLASGVEAPADSPPTLMLEEELASGFGGCNTFRGPYELDGDSISIGPLAGTLMACEEPTMTTEAVYLPALEAADSWAVEDGELVLSGDGEERLRFSAD